MHYGVTLWAYFSEPLVKKTVKVQLKNHNPRAPSYVSRALTPALSRGVWARDCKLRVTH